MPNRLLTRQEVYSKIMAPYLREIAKVLRANPLKPGTTTHIPGLFDNVGINLIAETEADTERFASAFEKHADDLTSDQT